MARSGSGEFWRKTVILLTCASLAAPLIGCAAPAPVGDATQRQFIQDSQPAAPSLKSEKLMTPEEWKTYSAEIDAQMAEARTLSGKARLEFLKRIKLKDIYGVQYDVDIISYPAMKFAEDNGYGQVIKGEVIGIEANKIVVSRVGSAKGNYAAHQYFANITYKDGVKVFDVFDVGELYVSDSDYTHNRGRGLGGQLSNITKALRGSGNQLEMIAVGEIGHKESREILDNIPGNKVKPVLIDPELAKTIPIVKLSMSQSGSDGKDLCIVKYYDKPSQMYRYVFRYTTGQQLVRLADQVPSQIVQAAEQDAASLAKVQNSFGPNGVAVAQAVEEQYPQLSNVAKRIVVANGLPVTPLMSEINIDGQLQPPEWFEVGAGGSGNPKDWDALKEFRMPLLVNSRTGQSLTLAWDAGDATLLERDFAITQESLRLAQQDVGKVQLLKNVDIGGKKITALLKTDFGTTLGAELTKNAAHASEILQAAFLQDVRLLSTTGVVHARIDPDNVHILSNGAVVTTDFAQSSVIDSSWGIGYRQAGLQIIWSAYQTAARENGLSMGQWSGPTQFLEKKAPDLLPQNIAGLLATPVAGTVNRVIMRSAGDQTAITLGREMRLQASDMVIDAEYQVLPEAGGNGTAFLWRRLAGGLGRAGFNFLKTGLEGIVYYEGAKTLHLMLYPVENPQATIGIPYTGENIQAKLNNELVVLKSLEDLRKETYASKEFMVQQLFYQKNTEQWALIQEEKHNILNDGYGSSSQAEKDKIGLDYDREMTAFLLRETIIGSKELKLNNILIDPPSFSTPIYAAATSKDHVIIWTTKKVNDQLGVVVLLEAAKVKENGKEVWKTIQQGSEIMTVKIQGKDRVVKFSQDAGILKVVIAAAGK